MYSNNQFSRAGTEIYLKSTGDLIIDQVPSDENAEIILRVMNGFQITYNDLEYTAHMLAGTAVIRLTGADRNQLFGAMIAFATGVTSSPVITQAIANENNQESA